MAVEVQAGGHSLEAHSLAVDNTQELAAHNLGVDSNQEKGGNLEVDSSVVVHIHMVQDQEVEHVLEMWDALVVVVHESLEEDHSPRGADGNRGACVQGVDSAVSCDRADLE